MFKRLTLCVVAACIAATTGLRAQSAPLTLPQALKLASEKYPAVRASLEQVEVAAGESPACRMSTNLLAT